MEQTRRDMLKGLVGLVATVALPDTSYGQEDVKRVPYNEYKSILNIKRILKPLSKVEDEKRRKEWDYLTADDQNFYMKIHTEKPTEQEKAELRQFYYQNRLTKKQKESIEDEIRWTMPNFADPLSPVNRLRYEIYKGIRIGTE